MLCSSFFLTFVQFWNHQRRFLTDEEREVLEADGYPVPKQLPFNPVRFGRSAESHVPPRYSTLYFSFACALPWEFVSFWIPRRSHALLSISSPDASLAQ